MQFNDRSAAKKPFKSGLIFIHQQGYHDLSISCISAILDQSNVPVTDMLVDHRIALHFQGINTIRTYPTKQEARYRNAFFVFNDLEWCARGNPSQKFNFAKRFRSSVFNFNGETERAILMFSHP